MGGASREYLNCSAKYSAEYKETVAYWFFLFPFRLDLSMPLRFKSTHREKALEQTVHDEVVTQFSLFWNVGYIPEEEVGGAGKWGGE